MDKGIVIASPSSPYRTLREASLAKEWELTQKAKKKDRSRKLQAWYLPLPDSLLDIFSRKITVWGFSYSMTAREVRRVHSRALASEGLLEGDV